VAEEWFLRLYPGPRPCSCYSLGLALGFDRVVPLELKRGYLQVLLASQFSLSDAMILAPPVNDAMIRDVCDISHTTS